MSLVPIHAVSLSSVAIEKNNFFLIYEMLSLRSSFMLDECSANVASATMTFIPYPVLFILQYFDVDLKQLGFEQHQKCKSYAC
jgi:hypothetical protein